jgi:hypothetical protein
LFFCDILKWLKDIVLPEIMEGEYYIGWMEPINDVSGKVGVFGILV